MTNFSWKLLQSFCKREFPSIVVGVVLLLAYSVALYLCPKVSGILVDQVVGSDSMEMVVPTLALFIVVCLVQPVLSYFSSCVFLGVTERTTASLRCGVFDATLAKSYFSAVQGEESQGISRVTNDARSVARVLSDLFSIGVKDVVVLVLVIVGMLSESTSLTLLIAILLGLYHRLNLHLSKKMERLSKADLQNYEGLCSGVSRSWKNLILIKAQGTEAEESQGFSRLVNRAYVTCIQVGKLGALASCTSNTVVVLSLACIYGLGAIGVMTGRLTLGSVLALGMYFQLLSSPILELSSLVRQLGQVRPCVERIESYLGEGGEGFLRHMRTRASSPSLDGAAARGAASRSLEDVEAGEETNPFRHAACSVSGGTDSVALQIELHQASFSYGAMKTGERKDESHRAEDEGGEVVHSLRERVLDSISVVFDGPGVTCLVGDSGSGKSTLLRVACGLIPVQSGFVEVCGTVIAHNKCSSCCAYVSQDAEQFVGKSVYANLTGKERGAGAKPSDGDDRLRGLLTRLGLNDAIDSLPSGLSTVIPSGDCFSGGERRRIALCRAVLSNRPILLLDEITTGLDSEAANSVVELLREVGNSRLVLVATHDARVMSIANEVFRIHEGKLVRER